MSKGNTDPIYMVRLAEEARFRESGEKLATYAVKGFIDDGISRYDQVMAVAEELAPGADFIDMSLAPPKEIAHLRQVSWRPRLVTENGLTAELIGRQTAEGWDSTYYADPAAAPQPSHGGNIFPYVYSIVK